MTQPVQGNCWRCGRGLTAADYGREAACPGCGKPTRVCRNCRHFAPGRANDCVEPLAEPVLDKDRANFCELFEPTHDPSSSRGGATQQDLVKAAQDLFK